MRDFERRVTYDFFAHQLDLLHADIELDHVPVYLPCQVLVISLVVVECAWHLLEALH